MKQRSKENNNNKMRKRKIKISKVWMICKMMKLQLNQALNKALLLIKNQVY